MPPKKQVTKSKHDGSTNGTTIPPPPTPSNDELILLITPVSLPARQPAILETPSVPIDPRIVPFPSDGPINSDQQNTYICCGMEHCIIKKHTLPKVPPRYRIASNSFTIQWPNLMGDITKADSDIQQVKPSRLYRSSSYESFEMKSGSNVFINLMRDKAESLGLLKGVTQSEELRDYLKVRHLESRIDKLCDQAKEYFKNEDRLVKIDSPCIVFGDIHGNLKDLLFYERLFWPYGPAVTGQTLLFLGDYVDRGKFSLEVILYLFALKVQCPDKVFLLRGNHEVSMTNRQYSFYDELTKKLGPVLGDMLWKKFNEVFDYLPLAAVIDEQVFCAHGGIPSPFPNSSLNYFPIEHIDHIPSPLSQPDQKSPSAMEILWNDPISDRDFMDLQGAQREPEDKGFLRSQKRGVGKLFTKEAAQAFLDGNKLTHILRAHETCSQGFVTEHAGLTTTVFSSSNYQSSSNTAGVVFVSRYAIRPVKINTNVYNLSTRSEEEKFK